MRNRFHTAGDIPAPDASARPARPSLAGRPVYSTLLQQLEVADAERVSPGRAGISRDMELDGEDMRRVERMRRGSGTLHEIPGDFVGHIRDYWRIAVVLGRTPEVSAGGTRLGLEARK